MHTCLKSAPRGGGQTYQILTIFQIVIISITITTTTTITITTTTTTTTAASIIAIVSAKTITIIIAVNMEWTYKLTTRGPLTGGP